MPKGGSVDNMSLSDHGPRSSSKGRPSNVSRPVVVDQQPPRESQGQQVHVQPQSTTAINVSPQRLALNNGRAYQEMDWKQDRLWREDNHTQTTSAYLNQAPVHTTNQVPSHMSGRLAYAPCSKNQQVRDCPPPNCAFHSSYILLVLPLFKRNLLKVLRHPSIRSSTQATGKLCTVCLLRFFTLVIPLTLSAKSCFVYPVLSKMASRSKRCNTKSSGRGSSYPC